MNDLEQLVIDLHDIARRVEQAFGICQLSIEIRRCADSLHEQINSTPQLNIAKGDQ